MFDFLAKEVEENSSTNLKELLDYELTARNIICAPTGKLLSAIDYKNEELGRA